MIQIKFPDASVRRFESGITVLEVAKNISEGLARNVLSAKFNQQTVEGSTPLFEDGNIQLFTWNDQQGKDAFWHSSAHVLAQTILSLYPKAKLTIGPAIENGFYYDVDFGDHSITEKELINIEKSFWICKTKICIQNEIRHQKRRLIFIIKMKINIKLN